MLACGSPKITYDYDDAIDFNQYKTYKIAVASELNLKKLDSVPFVVALEKALKSKNLIVSETPDLIILITRETHKAESNTSIGIGLGQQTRHLGINIGGAIPVSRNATTQNLTIDFRTVKDNKLVWQSLAVNTYKNGLPAAEKERMFFNFFQSILKGYPPSKTKK